MTVASSPEEGRELLRGTVERYRRNRDHYRSSAFDETSTRESFINTFFQALGWDVLDDSSRGPQRDVIFHHRLIEQRQIAGLEAWDEDLSEEEISARAPLVRIPDYAFLVGGSLRFFVEAKRPRVRLDGRGPAYQIKSYSWSRRTKIAVLSSFEQLRVFTCTVRPTYDDPRGGLLADFALRYDEYESAFGRLWDSLSREAVAAGSVDRLAGARPRGALQVDEAFLRELTGWRQRLAQDLVDNNPSLNQYEIAEATQRILDRVVFLRVCEDRGVEPGVVLRGYARRTDAYHQVRQEFRRLDGVYNGALFTEHFSERLEVSDGLFQRLVESLYAPRSPYRFDVIGADLLGAVYERFLGKELVVTRGRVELPDKPEVRHAGGVYYTPRWIVDAIVTACLAPMLDGKTPAAAAKLRIVDPACGSGSFLLGALEYLIGWHEHYYTRHPEQHRDRHLELADGTQRLTSDAKAELVRTCLFGVDIDPQAVEVAQMSLYLKILESENLDTLRRHPRLFHGPFLPSLSNNILSGNSLLAPDQVAQNLLYDEQLRRRINPFDWHDERRGFGQVFAERGGFDAVIGNPPYTRVQVLRQTRPEETRAYIEHYAAAASGSFDIAALFLEKGLSLLRSGGSRGPGGRLGYIVTRQFVETDAG